MVGFGHLTRVATERLVQKKSMPFLGSRFDILMILRVTWLTAFDLEKQHAARVRNVTAFFMRREKRQPMSEL